MSYQSIPSLVGYYEAAVLQGDIHDDKNQRQVLQHFQRLLDELYFQKKRWFFGVGARKKNIRGIYLYGSVGAGKTYLMDLFYYHIPSNIKRRFHFHHFMQHVDASLRQLQGHSNPVSTLAKGIAKSIQVLCLDEFLVQDVAHAMILAELLKTLIKYGVVVVTTANTAPDHLYANGVQRERFLPAIALLKEYCDVINLQDNRDYRKGRDGLSSSYFYPLNKETTEAITLAFQQLMPASECHGEDLLIQGRKISVVKQSKHVVWFDFNVICYMPRSQLDYLEIAECFHTVFLSDVPILKSDDTIKVLLFVHFIDVMYDCGVRVVISAAGAVNELYQEGPLMSMFQRTLSRLQEMQSESYIERHRYHLVNKNLYV